MSEKPNICDRTPKLLKSHACCGGEIRFYTHYSSSLALEAKFAVFLPAQFCQSQFYQSRQAAGQATGPKAPALYTLAGLTCTEETFLTKSNIVRFAADYGIILIAPDTSPRGAQIEGEEDAYDIGTGAGYYVDATAQPWARHYRMAHYVEQELPELIEKFFPVQRERCGIMGHSMGGAGALGFALRQPEKWKSVSAFAPISSPSQVGWGEKATKYYFGGEAHLWAQYDPVLLLQSGRSYPGEILIDQGMNDQFLSDYLRPELLEQAASNMGQNLLLRRHAGYDHSYWFIQSFIAEHMHHHAQRLLT